MLVVVGVGVVCVSEAFVCALALSLAKSAVTLFISAMDLVAGVSLAFIERLENTEELSAFLCIK